MSDTDGWLERFDQSHQQLTLPGLYWVSALLAVTGTTGVLWSLPAPEEFHAISPLLNWGSAFLMAATVYYFIISLSLAIGLLPFVVALAALQLWISTTGYSGMRIAVTLFVVALIGMAIGQTRGSGLRGVLRDVQQLMIAPAWMLSVIYRRIGIPV